MTHRRCLRPTSTWRSPFSGWTAPSSRWPRGRRPRGPGRLATRLLGYKRHLIRDTDYSADMVDVTQEMKWRTEWAARGILVKMPAPRQRSNLRVKPAAPSDIAGLCKNIMHPVTHSQMSLSWPGMLVEGGASCPVCNVWGCCRLDPQNRSLPESASCCLR